MLKKGVKKEIKQNYASSTKESPRDTQTNTDEETKPKKPDGPADSHRHCDSKC